MGAIIMMNSKKFLESFVEKYNYKNFTFVLISADIKTKGKYDNVYSIKTLLPPSKALSCGMNGNDKDSYKRKYFKHLSKPIVEIYLTTIVKLAVVEDVDVVLLCTDNEYELGYMEMLKEYLETIYKVKVSKYKDYKNNPEKCKKSYNKKKVNNILTIKVQQLSECTDDFTIEPSIVSSKLKKMKRKELIETAKNYGIKIKDDMSNKELIKKIKKKLL